MGFPPPPPPPVALSQLPRPRSLPDQAPAELKPLFECTSQNLQHWYVGNPNLRSVGTPIIAGWATNMAGTKLQKSVLDRLIARRKPPTKEDQALIDKVMRLHLGCVETQAR